MNVFSVLLLSIISSLAFSASANALSATKKLEHCEGSPYSVSTLDITLEDAARVVKKIVEKNSVPYGFEITESWKLKNGTDVLAYRVEYIKNGDAWETNYTFNDTELAEILDLKPALAPCRTLLMNTNP